MQGEDTNSKSEKLKAKKQWLKNARRKAIAYKGALELINSVSESKLINSYWRTYDCSYRYVENPETKIMETHRCKNRFCIKCASAYSAKMFTQYNEQLLKMQDPNLLTLTVKTVSGKNLKYRISEMQIIWRKIMKSAN